MRVCVSVRGGEQREAVEGLTDLEREILCRSNSEKQRPLNVNVRRSVKIFWVHRESVPLRVRLRATTL